jgi:hypothetical protein
MEMMDQSEDQLKLILSQFVEETPRKISVIRKAIEDNDALNLKTNVHYMASSIHHLKIASLYKPLSKIDRPKFLEIGTKEKELGEQICTTLEMVIEKLKLKYQC